MPIEKGHDMCLHVEHTPPLLALVERESLQWLTLIIKLCQHTFVVAGNQWTGRVTIVLETKTGQKIGHCTELDKKLASLSLPAASYHDACLKCTK